MLKTEVKKEKSGKVKSMRRVRMKPLRQMLSA